MQEVRAAVIGTGVMGRKYAQMIAEGKAGALRLTTVVCRSAEAQQWAKDTLPDTVRVCPSADQLYDYAEEFDAVLVVTPHKTHPALVMQAFVHGKHVLCDKPSANALAPALEMNRAAEKSGLVFAMMFHQRRYKKYIKLKNLLESSGYTLSIPLEYLNSCDVDCIIKYITTQSIDLGDERIYNYVHKSNLN